MMYLYNTSHERERENIEIGLIGLRLDYYYIEIIKGNNRIGRFGLIGRCFLMGVFDIGAMSKPIISSNPVFSPIRPIRPIQKVLSKLNPILSNPPETVQTWERRIRCLKGLTVFRYHFPLNRLQQEQDTKEERLGDYSAYFGLDTKFSYCRSDRSA